MAGDSVTTVATVRGPVEVSALGTTLMHEHVFITIPEVQANWTLKGGQKWEEEPRILEEDVKPPSR